MGGTRAAESLRMCVENDANTAVTRTCDHSFWGHAFRTHFRGATFSGLHLHNTGNKQHNKLHMKAYKANTITCRSTHTKPSARVNARRNFSNTLRVRHDATHTSVPLPRTTRDAHEINKFSGLPFDVIMLTLTFSVQFGQMSGGIRKDL